jgi:hypothetical protein
MDSAAILTMPRDPRTRRGEENDSRNVAAGNRYGAGGWCLGAQSAHESEAVLGRDHPNQTESAAADAGSAGVATEIATLSKELGWSHFVELLPLKKHLQRLHHR